MHIGTQKKEKYMINAKGTQQVENRDMIDKIERK